MMEGNGLDLQREKIPHHAELTGLLLASNTFVCICKEKETPVKARDQDIDLIWPSGSQRTDSLTPEARL